MDCKNFQAYSSAYIDNMLSEEEELDFKNHIEECITCNIAFENLKTVVESTNMIGEIELPADFSNELHEKLQDAKKYKFKSSLLSKGKILSGIAATLLILVLSLSLVNNFLNYKKGTEFYSGTDDIIPKEENIDIADTHDEVKRRTSDKTDEEKSIMGLKNAPTNDNEAEKDALEESQEDVKEYSMGKAEEDTGFIARSNGDEKPAANENEQDIPDERKLNRIISSIVILILISGMAFLVHKMIKNDIRSQN